MQSRLPVANALAICAFAVAFGLVGLALSRGSAARQLGAGIAQESPAGNISVADIFAPPNYVLEAWI
jgi:hypothetical protein